jgi:hypothetical protein
MTKKRKVKATILFLLLVGILVGISGCKESEFAKKKASDATEKSELDLEEKRIKEEADLKQKSAEDLNTEEAKESEDDKLSMELIGIEEEQLKVMEVSKTEIADALKKWAEENGYSSAVGAEFYDPMWIRFSESKYTIGCQLIFDNQGNGITEEDSQSNLSMDYYKSKKIFQFHR